VVPTGEGRTNTKSSDLNPVWNEQLQIPMYEPMFRQLIYIELWNEGMQTSLVSRLSISWKDIFTRQDWFKQPHWYDLYCFPDKNFIENAVQTAKWAGRKVGMKLNWKTGTGEFEEQSVYCGRLLFSVEIEDREGGKAPSLAQTDMKPKDCKLFQDVRQKVFFRFQVFHAQGLNVGAGYAQVELTIGRRTMKSKAVAAKANGMFQWYEALELEDDYVYDDKAWQWTEEDYEAGRFPSGFVDAAIPDVWLRVFKCSGVASALGEAANDATRKLIGFYRCSLRELLDIGEPPTQPFVDASGSRMMETTLGNEKGNVILNKIGSSLPSFFIPAAEKVNPQFDPSKRSAFRAVPGNPPWPMVDDGRGNDTSMDPYKGIQCIMLSRDGTCDLESAEFAGFVWVSLKAYLPSREQCKSAKKGPPILSPSPSTTRCASRRRRR
jgi:hypothetical protein